MIDYSNFSIFLYTLSDVPYKYKLFVLYQKLWEQSAYWGWIEWGKKCLQKFNGRTCRGGTTCDRPIGGVDWVELSQLASLMIMVVHSPVPYKWSPFLTGNYFFSAKELCSIVFFSSFRSYRLFWVIRKKKYIQMSMDRNSITEDNGMICCVCKNAVWCKAIGLSCIPTRIILECQ